MKLYGFPPTRSIRVLWTLRELDIAIVLYLAAKHPEKGLLPSGLRERAEVDRWLFFCATELEQPVWRIVRPTWRQSPRIAEAFASLRR